MRVPRVIASLENIIKPLNTEGSLESFYILGESETSIIVASITKEIDSKTLPKLHLVFPIIKTSRLEIMLEKVVELGVSSITFFEASHSRPGATAKNLRKKISRLDKIKEQALKQSRSSIDTKLLIEGDLKSLLPSIPDTFFSLLSLNDAKSLSSSLNYNTFSSQLFEYVRIKKNEQYADLYIMVGPEAGFSKDEITLLEKHKCTPVSFGPNILRAETAAISAVAVARELLM